MARGAVDVETFLAALEYGTRNGEGNPVNELIADFSCEEDLIGAQFAASYGPFGKWPCRAAVGEEVAGPQRNVLGLVLHVTAASDIQTRQHGYCERQQGTSANRPYDL
jgi:hypothetical protein